MIRLLFFLCFAVITEARHQLVIDAYRNEDFDTAQEHSVAMLNDNPFDPHVNYNLGNTLYRKNDFEKAAASFDRVARHVNDEVLKDKQTLIAEMLFII